MRSSEIGMKSMQAHDFDVAEIEQDRNEIVQTSKLHCLLRALRWVALPDRFHHSESAIDECTRLIVLDCD